MAEHQFISDAGVKDAYFIGEIRIAILQSDGSLIEGHSHGVDDYANTVPSVGDVLASLWPYNDNEVFRVVERIHIVEFNAGTYWLVIVEQISKPLRYRRAFALGKKISSQFIKIQDKIEREKKAKQDKTIKSLTEKRKKKPAKRKLKSHQQ